MVTPRSSEPTGGAGRSATSTSPGWLDELVTILDARRNLVVASAVGLSLLGMLAAAVLPQFVPPRPLVGAAVGLAAALLAVAIAVAADSADLTVRGARHVRAAGGQLAAVLGADATPSAAADLAARIDARAAAGGRHWVAVAPASRGFGSVSAWADALGVALADAGRRVVVIDLANGPTPGRPGVVEVVNDELKLGQAVVFDPERMMARLRPGADDVRALQVVTGLVPRLPSDIEILVLALPALGQPGALAAAGVLDRVLVVAEVDATPRVDLIASLDAVDATDTAAEVILVDRRPGAGVEEGEPAPAWDDEPAATWDDDEPAATWDDDEPTAIWDDEPTATWDDEPAAATPPPRPEPELHARPEADAPPEVRDVGEPTVEFDPWSPGDAPRRDDDPHRAEPPRDHLREHGRWAGPPAHEALTGASLDAPEPAPLAPDEPDDDVRVTAALQTLAQEVWSRDVDGG